MVTPPTMASSTTPSSSSQIWRIRDMRSPYDEVESGSQETLLSDLDKDLAPARQPGQRVARALRADALPQPLAVEAEHRRQVGPARCGANLGDQAVEDQRIGSRARVVGEHHVRLHRAAWRPELRTHVDHAQLGHRHAAGDEAEVLADRVVLAVATALLEHLQ